MLRSNIDSWDDLRDKRVLLRLDLNVAITTAGILDDFRLISARPVIDLLSGRGASIIIVAHLGRPDGFVPDLSLSHLLPWFIHHGYSVVLVDRPENIPAHVPGNRTIFLLENIRFFRQEYTQDLEFARLLASLATFYVNDAFGALHRSHTSLTTVAQFFDENHRSIGPLIEKELSALAPLIEKQEHPFLCLLGGGKISTKLPYIEKLIDRPVDAVALLPALSFTFFEARGISMGLSLVDRSFFGSIESFVLHARKNGVSLLFPSDFLVARGSWNGPLEVHSSYAVPSDAVGVSCGPQTIVELLAYIKNARMIFLNAGMGDISRSETIQPLQMLLQAIVANKQAYTVVGGGESVAALRTSNINGTVSHCSTGGGSTLALICGMPLPGLDVFC